MMTSCCRPMLGPECHRFRTACLFRARLCLLKHYAAITVIAAGQCWPLGALGPGDWGSGQVVARAAQASLCQSSGGPERPNEPQVSASLPSRQLGVPMMGCTLPARPVSTGSANVVLVGHYSEVIL